MGNTFFKKFIQTTYRCSKCNVKIPKHKAFRTKNHRYCATCMPADLFDTMIHSGYTHLLAPGASSNVTSSWSSIRQ